MKEALARLERLEYYAQQAKKVCDPTEFAYRQNRLLHVVADYLLEPLYEEEDKDKGELESGIVTLS